MTSPTYCTSCGHELGVGRFCINCGRPVPGLRREVRWLPIIVGLVLLAVVAGAGGYLLVSRADERAADDRTEQSGPSDAPPSSATDGSQPAQPDSSGSDGPVEAPDADDVVRIDDGISAQVPAVAPPSRDSGGRPVRFRPANMWDGRPRTAWRMPGDGTGQTLTFDLGAEVVLTDVGLVNGYAKVDGPNDWYDANRRIRRVQWEFDDGTRVTQDLADVRSLQSTEVGPVRTRTVSLHLLEVSAPAEGPGGRNFTAISEIRLRGVR